MGALDWLSDLLRTQDVPDPNAVQAPQGILGQAASNVGGLLGGAITGYGERVIGPGADKASNMAKVFAALQHVGTSVAAGFGNPVAREIIAQRAMRDPQEEQARSLQIQSAQMKLDADARQRDVFSQMGAGGFDPRNPAHRSRFMDLAVQSGDMSLIDKARELESTYGKSEAPQSELGRLQLDQWKSRYAGNDPGTSADMAYQRKIDALSRPEPAKANPMRTRIEGDQSIQEELGPDGWQAVGSGPRFQAPAPRAPVAIVGPDGNDVYVSPEQAIGRTPANQAESEITKATRTSLEKEQIGYVRDLTRLEDSIKGFDPNIFTYAGRGGRALQGVASSAGILNEDAKAKLQEQAGYVQRISMLSAELIHNLYGGALTPGEEARANQFIVSRDDSPDQAIAKLRGLKAQYEAKIAANASALKNGVRGLGVQSATGSQTHPSQDAPQTKMLNGKTYVKVPGGWVPQ